MWPPQMTPGYFLLPAFLTNWICQENQVKQCFWGCQHSLHLKQVMCFLSHSSPLQQRFYNPNGRAMWRKVCTSLLLAILLGKINHRAYLSDPIWILKLSKKQFSLRGYQKEVKGLLINQTNITRKGQKTGEYCDMGPLQSYSFSFTHTKSPNVSNDFGYLSLWKQLKGDPPGFAPLVHGVIIDPTLLHFVEMYVVCTSIEVISFSFGKLSFLTCPSIMCFLSAPLIQKSKMDEKEIGKIWHSAKSTPRCNS